MAGAGSPPCSCFYAAEPREFYSEICSAKDQAVLHWWRRILGARRKAVKVLHYLTWCSPLNLITALCNRRGIDHLGCCTAPQELGQAGWTRACGWQWRGSVAHGCALINPVGNGDGVRERRWTSMLRSVSVMVIRREQPSTQLSFCGYLFHQILQDTVLDTKKTIFKSNLLHCGS